MRAPHAVQQIASHERRLKSQLAAAGQASRSGHHAQVATGSGPARPGRADGAQIGCGKLRDFVKLTDAPADVGAVDHALSRGRLTAGTAAVALASAVFAVWVGLGIGGHEATLWFDDTATPLAALIACVLCVAARARGERQMRLFWTLLAAATASWTVAELIWGYYALVLARAVPIPSWADVGYLGAIPLAVAALIAHPATRGNRARTARSILEGLLVATSLLFLSWTLVLGAVWRSTDLGTLGGIVSVAYPFGDVVIIFFIVLAIRGMTSGERLPLWWLLAGLFAMALSDSGFTYLSNTSNYTSPGLIDTGWVVAYLVIGLAAFSSRQGDVRVRGESARSRPSLASLVAPIVPVLVALTVLAVQSRLGDHIDHAAWIMAFALIALVLIRQALALIELLAPGNHDGGANLITKLTDAALGPGAGDGHGSASQA